MDVTELQYKGDGNKGADSWNRFEALYAEVIYPAPGQSHVQRADLLIK